MRPDLYELSDAVSDEETFLAFLDVLREDYLEDREAAARGEPRRPVWENRTLPAFLEAAVAWARDKPAALEAEEDAALGIDPAARAAEEVAAVEAGGILSDDDDDDGDDARGGVDGGAGGAHRATEAPPAGWSASSLAPGAAAPAAPTLGPAVPIIGSDAPTVAPVNPWRRLARILHAGKFYE